MINQSRFLRVIKDLSETSVLHFFVETITIVISMDVVSTNASSLEHLDTGLARGKEGKGAFFSTGFIRAYISVES